MKLRIAPMSCARTEPPSVQGTGVKRRGFLRARDGISIVEFALVAPVMILLFLGSIDVGRAVSASNRVSYVSATIGELVSQATDKLTPDQIDGFIALAPLINPDILRYGRQTGNTNIASLSKITVSSVTFTKTSATCTVGCVYVGAVVFSRTNSGTVRPCGLITAAPDGSAGTPTSVPTSLYGPDSLVVIDVEIPFKPILISSLPLPTSFKSTSYYRPRTLDRVNSTQNCAGFIV